MDQYQKRYLAHQKKKKIKITEMLRERHSDRVFLDKEISTEHLDKILNNTRYCPSSCNRKAVTVKIIKLRDYKSLLSGLLVGGVGWLHQAKILLLLKADKKAYKENLFYMPYLDAGFMAYNIWLTCTELGIGCCFINPNIREKFKSIIYEYNFLEKHELLCGVIAIGYTDE